MPSHSEYVGLIYPGTKTKLIVRILVGVFLILLTISGFLTALPTSPVKTANPNADKSLQSSSSGSDMPDPQTAVATPLSGLSLPETVVSGVDNMINSGGVTQATSDNLTLYNRGVRIRLLGGLTPHDELLSPTGQVISTDASWTIQANVSGAWTPLVPTLSNFTIRGTNKTGTFVVRTMHVQTGLYSGTLSIFYKALSSGPLRWDIRFAPDFTGQYRLGFSIWNLTSAGDLTPAWRQLRLNFSSSNYTFSWNDVPLALNTGASASMGRFTLNIDLGRILEGTTNYVDPSIVGSCNSCTSSTDIVRRIFYEPKAGYYWVFYDNGTQLLYKNSRDGSNWSNTGSIPFPDPRISENDPGFTDYEIPVYYSGQQVIVAKGGLWYSNYKPPYTAYANVSYSVGNITGSTIKWGSVRVWDQPSRVCDNGGSSCSLWIGVRFVNLIASSDGTLAVSYEWFSWGDIGKGLCLNVVSGGENAIVVKYKTQRLVTSCLTNPSLPNVDGTYLYSNILPSDSHGGLRVLYAVNGGLFSQWLDGLNDTGSLETIEPVGVSGNTWSAVADSSYGNHVVYQGTNVSYAYHSATGLGWTSTLNIFGLQTTDPTITVDQTTNDVYAFGIFGQNNSIVMKRKPLSRSWSDQSPVFPITRLPSWSHWLGSNYASASGTNASMLMLVWQESVGSYQYNTVFASIPLQTVWSPFGFPADPWDGNGISPYGQYFSNLREYVSTSTGMLTVRQTDLTLSGRGLDFDITRVYAEPSNFLYGPSIENYPWAPMGNGWQLNFPWMENVSNPSYIHLSDGQAYKLPSSFWNICRPLQNNLAESFYIDCYYHSGSLVDVRFWTVSGIVYVFDVTHSNRLIKFNDSHGNTISLGYDSNNRIANATDTVGRVFQFCYNSGLLRSINQTSGNCSSNSGSLQGIVFGYSGNSLIKVTDPAGRATSYQYQAVSDPSISPWIISRITYPTHWYTNYTYAPSLLGTEATTYRVKLQYVGSPSASIPIRQFAYRYAAPSGDYVTNSTVTTYDGNTVVSYTLYGFSFAGDNQTIYDPNHVFMHGVQQRFGVRGEVVKEIVMVSPTQGFTNYYGYDLWGNRIFSHQVINPSTSWYHDSFNAYYNEPIQPGFYSFEETFGQNQGNSTENLWYIQNGYWMVQNGAYNGTARSGDGQSIFSWTNSTSPNLTLQARVYIGRLVNTSYPKVGIFTHYAGTGTSKWALVYEVDGSGNGWVSLLDDKTGLDLSWSCRTVSLGKWYTFSLSVVGNATVGSITSADGSVNCSTGNNTFPSNIDGLGSATGIGVYAGGYSALFTDVTAVPIYDFSSFSGFSNSFIQNGAPTVDPDFHDFVAGNAELQNGTATRPVETYYGYTSWGSLNQTKLLMAGSFCCPQWTVSTATYDSHGNQLTSTNGNGNTINYAYSSQYKSVYLTNESHTIGSTKITQLFAYNFNLGTRTSTVDPNGYNTTFQYDILGRLTKVNYPNGLGYVQHNYNDQSNYENITNENGWLTQQTYDGLGRLSTIVRFRNGIPYSNASYTYNWQDKIVNETDAIGNRMSHQYDALGRLTKTIEPNRNSTSITYNDAAPWVLSIDENGVYTCETYDRVGRLLSVILNSTSSCQPGIVTNYSHDEVGNLVRTTSSTGQRTTYGYDNLNRLLQTSYADNTSESYTYDFIGNIRRKTDRQSIAAQYSYDSLNRLISAAHPGTTQASDNFTYDANSNLIRLASNNATLIYGYDARNRVTSETYQVNSGFAISINPSLVNFYCTPSSPCYPTTLSLNVSSFRKFSGNVALSYVQPSSGTGGTSLTGPSSVNLVPGGSVKQNLTATHGTSTGTYVWTVTGQSGGLTVSMNVTISEYICTGRGCPQSPSRPPIKNSPAIVFSSSSPNNAAAAYTVSYGYGGETETNMTYPDGLVVKYSYDQLGRIITGSTGSTQYISFVYNPNDQVTNATYGNGLKASYTFDHLSRPLNFTLTRTTQLLSLANSYYKTGTVASVVGEVNGTNVNEQYRYDALHRLSNATLTNGGSTVNYWYLYDSVGNQLSQRISPVLTKYYTYNSSNNELLQATLYNPQNHQFSTAGSYAYDNDGNLHAANITTSGMTHWTYTWSPQGELLRVSNDNGLRGAYAYDGLNRKVESTEASTTYYAYLGTNTLSELVSGGPTTDYVSAGGLLIARVTGTTTTYYHADALGSTRITTNSAGSVVFSDNYLPFGSDNNAKGTETYKFTGKPVSQTTGLYYYGARWYDPTVGRFISRDPFAGQLSDPQSLNPYVYVENSPTSSTDPTGLADCGWNPGTWLGCAENGGAAAWSGLTTAGSDIANAWNSQPAWAKYTEIGVGVAAAVILTAGLAAPELLVLVPPLLVGDFGAGAGAASVCEEDPEACDPIPPPPGPDVCECPTIGDANPGFGESGAASSSSDVVDIPRGGFDEARAAGAYGNQPLQLAEGNYAHGVLTPGLADQGLNTQEGLTPGNFPDAWNENGFVEIKPYHEGINPFEEYGPQLNRYTQAFIDQFGYAPNVKLILYRFI